LEGTLESFAIGEILQLVSQQAKTGTLEIRTSEGMARLRFREGKLLEAWPEKRTPTELIGERLARAGLVTAAQLEHALRNQRQTLRPLGDILIRSGTLRIAEFQEILGLQHRETVYQLLRLKRGTFQFIPETVEIEEGVSVPMEVDALLMEGARQVDEWPRVLERVSSENRIFAREEGKAGSDLSQEEARALSLVDGVSTVRETVDRSRLGEFAGWEALASLVDRGLIVPVNQVRRPRPTEIARATSPRRSPVDALLAVVCMVAAGVLMGAWLSSGAGQVSRFVRALDEARLEARKLADRQSAWTREFPAAWPLVPSGDG
jgi:hypothetical protein